MTDPTAIRQGMIDLGITIAELAAESGLSACHVGRQLRGDLPLQRRVQRALVGVLDERALAALPHVARLLMDHGEPDAADACERLSEVLRQPTAGECPTTR